MEATWGWTGFKSRLNYQMMPIYAKNKGPKADPRQTEQLSKELATAGVSKFFLCPTVCCVVDTLEG